MRTAVIFLALLAVSFAISAEDKFQVWRVENHKFYANAAEYHKRFAIFNANAKYIEQENVKGHSYELGLNYFADMTYEEFVAMYTAYMPEVGKNICEMENTQSFAAPDSIDQRDHGLVNPIKDQGQCGSCYAFGGMVAVEAAYAAAHKELYNFAEQEIVDCDTTTGNQACNGGWQYWTMQYVVEKGICQTHEYPYTARKGTCNKSCQHMQPITGCKQVASKTEDTKMKEAASKTVLAVAIYASQNFQLYKSGILDDAKCSTYTNPNHAVAVVGYDSENGKDYWIVRNSWGTSWGERGYIKMVRNAASKCRIAEYVYYAVSA